MAKFRLGFASRQGFQISLQNPFVWGRVQIGSGLRSLFVFARIDGDSRTPS